MQRRKRIIAFLLLLVGALLLVVFYCDRQVRLAAAGKTYSNVTELPHHHVGLLLGTGKYMGNGVVNPYYRYRIEAATQLLKAGKVDYLVISGDNSRKSYNEPESMRMDLVAAGIDSSRIFLDYAGFRTFDSMVRLRETFSQDTATVISQPFHNERALFIASREGMTVIGFNAEDVTNAAGLRTQLREKLARVKAFADYWFHTKPKFLGPKANIPRDCPYGS